MRYLLAVAVLLVSSTAMAWNAAGHKMIASIAFRQLTPAQQSAIVEILKKHPRYEEDFKAKMPAELADEKEQNEWVFQQAAAWPDLVKSLRGEAAKYNHPTWHYIDIPVYLTPADKALPVTFNMKLDPPAKPEAEMNAIQTIRMARKMLANKSTPDDEKAIWICWLFHDVGDIHQPLHASALMAKNLFPSGDKGGNGIKTDQHGNLHSLWDSLLGTSTNFRTIRNKAIAFVNDPEQAKLGKDAAAKLNEKDWLDESHTFAESVAYDAEVTGFLRGHIDESQAPSIHLSERYLKDGGAVAEKQVVKAGYRLGAILKQVADGQK